MATNFMNDVNLLIKCLTIRDVETEYQVEADLK